MKKNNKTRLILFIGLLFLHMSGCGVLDSKKNIDLEKAAVCVVETNAYDPDSALVFYDENLNEMGKMPLKYASLGESFYAPEIYNNELYIVPQGHMYKKDEKKILRINLSSLDTEIYTIEQYAINSICVNESNIYSANTMNADSHISKCNKQTHRVSEYIVENEYISKLVCTNERVYAFGTVSKGNSYTGHLYIFDAELNLINQLDITDYGCDQYKAVIKEDKIYFSNSYDSKGVTCNTVGVYSISDNKVENINLDNDYPHDILFYNDMLLISHYDIVRNEGGGLSLYNPGTKERTYIDLGHGASNMSIIGNHIFFLDKYDVYKYKLENDRLKFEKKVSVPPLRNDYFYCSGLFTF